MKQTVKNSILSYLSEKPDWVYGGTLEKAIGEIAKCKQSNVGRRCRELQDEGKIERRIKDGVVQYRLTQIPSHTRFNPYKELSSEKVNSKCCFSYSVFSTHDRNCETLKQTTNQLF